MHGMLINHASFGKGFNATAPFASRANVGSSAIILDWWIDRIILACLGNIWDLLDDAAKLQLEVAHGGSKTRGKMNAPCGISC